MGYNQNRQIKLMANTESAYGTLPTFTPADDGFFAYNNANPVGLDVSVNELDAIRDGFTPVKSAIGRFLRPFTPTIFAQGSGVFGTPVRFNDMIRACAMKETIAGSSSSIVYTPRSTSLESCGVAADLGGIYFAIAGLFGTWRMSGSAGQPVEWAFDMRGLWTQPANVAAQFSGWSGGSNLAQTLKSAGLVIDNGTVAWSGSNPAGENRLVFKSFNFDRGLTIGETADANADDGLARVGFDGMSKPKLTVVVEMKDTLTGLANLEADIKAGTTHDVSFQVGKASGSEVFREWYLSFPTAQPVNLQYQDGDGGTRVISIDYNVQHDTEGSEFAMTLK